MREQPHDGLTLFAPGGNRKYLNAAERLRFVEASHRAPLRIRLFCLTLRWSGARISEALALTPAAIDVESGVACIETLKRRRRGVVRQVPLPPDLLDELDRAFELRMAQQDAERANQRLWRFSRTTAWRYVKGIMAAAGIVGAPATPKGLRHGFGVHAVQAKVPPTLVQRWLGHASLRTTSIYINVSGAEERAFAALMWYKPRAIQRFMRAARSCMFDFLKGRRERREQALADADALTAKIGAGAYQEARSRAREGRRRSVIDANRADGHWDRVRRIIGRKTGHTGLDTATRYLTRE